ncbi:hypothetical protein HPG69_019312 [Diceros bicornis minor]|uniref:Uncharacterized protein n=1 Tax=Diceros bicornis minor TaxID=77932 RepID=A0A7J7FMV9_DICBM|nr:hypothetical protein HPG69_019312 [Diceros bicornis minor]
MAPPSGGRQISKSKMAHLAKNKIVVTRAGAAAWKNNVLKSLEDCPGKLLSLHEYQGGQDTWSWGAEFFEAIDRADEGKVKHGILYGPQKICINQTCLDTTILHYAYNLDKLSREGYLQQF